MNKMTRLYFFMVLSVMAPSTAIFANYSSGWMTETNSNSQQQMYNYDSHSQENQSQDSSSVMVGDRSWETTSSRMNRQATNPSNTRFNPNQNRDEQTRNGSWETTSSRMNRQAATVNTRSPTWIRDEQNHNDSNAPIRGNVQR